MMKEQHYRKSMPLKEKGEVSYLLGPLQLGVRFGRGEAVILWNGESRSRYSDSTANEAIEPSPRRSLYFDYQPGMQLCWEVCLPDRPVIVFPETPIQLSPLARVDLQVSIPLFVRIGIEDAREILWMDELPVSVMSNTWVGDNFQGSMGYSLHQQPIFVPKMGRSASSPYPDHQVRVLMELHNRKKEPVTLDELMVPCPELKLFLEEEHLEAHPVGIHYEKDSDAPRVKLGEPCPWKNVFSEPRVKPQSGFIGQRLGRLRNTFS